MADLNSLRNLLESRGYFNVGFNEFPLTDSINSTSTYYLRRRISERIAASDIVLGVAGIYVSYSDCMKWKLDKAIEKKILIVGVIFLNVLSIMSYLKDMCGNRHDCQFITPILAILPNFPYLRLL